jgi:hypothetical protein
MSVASDIQQKASLQVALGVGILFFIVQIGLSRTAAPFLDHKLYSFLILSLIGIVSGCAGWTFGIFLSPIGSQLNGAQKVLAAIAVFWSGIVVSHLEQMVAAFASWQKAPLSPGAKIELVFSLGLFLLALCVTFNTRFDSERGGPAPAAGSLNSPQDSDGAIAKATSRT